MLPSAIIFLQLLLNDKEMLASGSPTSPGTTRELDTIIVLFASRGTGGAGGGAETGPQLERRRP